MKDTVILIAGSSRGIGAETAIKAKAQGMTVVLHGQHNSDELQTLATQLDALSVTFDVSNEQSVQEGISTIISKYGRLDILVNSAGIVVPATLQESTESNWIDHFKVNVIGAVNLTKSVAPHMKKQGHGSIVNISSIHGHSDMASEGVAAYSASKAALINLTVSSARELAPYINVNVVSPGFTETDMSSTWPPHVWTQAKSNLLGRVATTDDIANAVLFLAGKQASFITGQSLIVDGGYGISNR